MNKEIFEYGVHHFIPERQFTREEDDFFVISRRQRRDKELGFCKSGNGYESKYPYSPEDFYAVSPEKECDLFRCMENGKLYLPCENDLQEYVEAEKCKLPKSTRPKERIEENCHTHRNRISESLLIESCDDDVICSFPEMFRSPYCRVILQAGRSLFLLHDYMATCHVGMEYRTWFLNQGAGRIFLTEDFHPAYGSLTVLPCAV